LWGVAACTTKKLKRKRINYGFHSCSQIQGAHTSFHNSFGNGDLGLTGRQPVNLSWFLEAPLGLGVQFKSLHLESRNLKKNWQNFSQLLMPLNAVGGRGMKRAATVFLKINCKTNQTLRCSEISNTQEKKSASHFSQ
jgi:hypothetical protein